MDDDVCWPSHVIHAADDEEDEGVHDSVGDGGDDDNDDGVRK